VVVEIYSKSRLLFYFLSIGNPYYQEGLWSTGFDLELLLKRTHTNTCEPQKPLQNNILRVSLLKPESSGLCLECPGTLSGVSGYPFTNG
jgi:hypothetical protein